MRTKRNTTRTVCVAMLATALTSLAFAGSASAKLTGEYTKFEQCPWTTSGVIRCIHATTEGGEVVIGSKKVTISGKTVLQGGFKEQDEKTEMAEFVGAKNGITLSKTPQAVPGGLLGIVPPESSPPLVKALSKFFFENALTGVNSTLELAQAASNIRISDSHLGEEFGTALEMPVKIRLENPFLGKNCYVGSSGSPVLFKLTSGETNPPAPNKKINGASGAFKLFDGGRILGVTGTELVDNAWSAPKASGCGGLLSFLVNPIINSQIGLPAASGVNTAILKNTSWIGSSFAVQKNDEENP